MYYLPKKKTSFPFQVHSSLSLKKNISLTASGSVIFEVILDTASPIPLANLEKPPLLRADVFFALGSYCIEK